MIESDSTINNIPLIRPIPPTTVSFIELHSLLITPSESLHNNELKIKFSLHNQFIELKAIKTEDNFVYEINTKELFYMYDGK